MIKQHKKMLILTSVITLLPIFIGLLLWRQLPASVATHFGVDNQPDGYCSKAFAVFGLPVMMLFFHLICIVATNIDPKRKNISKKVFHVWSVAKEGEGKRKERNGLNYLIYGIIIPETDTQRNMMRAGHGARLRRCRTVISKAWMD